MYVLQNSISTKKYPITQLTSKKSTNAIMLVLVFNEIPNKDHSDKDITLYLNNNYSKCFWHYPTQNLLNVRLDIYELISVQRFQVMIESKSS
ncbi:TPA: hypothetical protein DCZ39_04560 [Patescibacteria group bacterium]|nr:hypothetical protein [Candidatus Gracilibacteria bacterium]